MRGLVHVLFIFILFGVVHVANARDVNCDLHQLYCKVVELRPSINKAWAMEFSDHLYELSDQYQTDPWRSLAIAMQESSLRNVHKKERVIVFKESCNDNGCVEDYEILDAVSDLGLFQFNVRTIMEHDIDPLRLKNDLRYVVDWHLQILKQKMEVCNSLGDEAWSCYHSKTPRFRERYVKMVDRYYFGESKKQDLRRAEYIP